MRLRYGPCWLPKAGNSAAEYEDAVWPVRTLELSVPAFRCSVADGATETSFSGLWAQLLVRAWCRGQLSPPQLERSLQPLARTWSQFVTRQPLPWYAEEKARAGAFAAFLGVSFAADGTWRALAVGDSCVFQLRGRRLVSAFPVTASADFSSRPLLIGTSIRPGELPAAMHLRSGSWRSGDRFLLMTDALAQWYLWRHEYTGDTRPLSAAQFAVQIARLRQGGCLRNDDVTLVDLRVDAYPRASSAAEPTPLS